MPPARWRASESPLATAWRPCAGTEEANGASGSTINCASASDGRRAMPSTWRSSTITRSRDMTIKRSELGAVRFGNLVTGRRLAPVHPGEILLGDFIGPLGITRYRVAKAIGVPQRRIDEICMGKRAMTADTA